MLKHVVFPDCYVKTCLSCNTCIMRILLSTHQGNQTDECTKLPVVNKHIKLFKKEKKKIYISTKYECHPIQQELPTGNLHL